jgi:hypothetical protein
MTQAGIVKIGRIIVAGIILIVTKTLVGVVPAMERQFALPLHALKNPVIATSAAEPVRICTDALALKLFALRISMNAWRIHTIAAACSLIMRPVFRAANLTAEDKWSKLR